MQYESGPLTGLSLAAAITKGWECQSKDEYQSENTINDSCSDYVRKQLAASGEESEWEVFVPPPHILTMDYDNGFPRERFDRAMELLIKYVQGVPTVYEHTSRSGNKHVVIDTCKSMSPVERVAWQAIFGSDPVREALHLQSFKDGRQDPILLVMRKNRECPVKIDKFKAELKVYVD